MNMLSKILIVGFIVISVGCQGSFENQESFSDDPSQISVTTVNPDKEYKLSQSKTPSNKSDKPILFNQAMRVESDQPEQSTASLNVDKSKETSQSVEPSQEDKGNSISAQDHADDVTTGGIVKVEHRGYSSGTGFFISPHTIVTNFHVMDSIRKSQGNISEHLFIVHPETNARIPVHSIQAIGANHDLAVLHIKDYESPVYYELFEESEETLSSLEAYIFDRREISVPKIEEGALSSYYAFQTNKMFSLFSDQLEDLDGLSGSPIFSVDGKVIGVLAEQGTESQKILATLSSPKAVKELLLSSFFNCESVKCVKEDMLLPESDRIQEYELIDSKIADTMYLAEQGSMYDQFNLGARYTHGQWVEQDHKEAEKWYRLSAEQGYFRAQYNLGWMYLSGKGVEEDAEEAVYWYTLAAEQGDASAQYLVGFMYANGVGGVVRDNEEEAVNWYRKAAEQGHAKAQRALERLRNKKS